MAKSRKNTQRILLLFKNWQKLIDSLYPITGLKPNVVIDGCKSRQGKSETIFEIKTKKLHQLPLTDFHPIDYGNSNQAFGFRVGPVCFKWIKCRIAEITWRSILFRFYTLLYCIRNVSYQILNRLLNFKDYICNCLSLNKIILVVLALFVNYNIFEMWYIFKTLPFLIVKYWFIIFNIITFKLIFCI